MFLFLKLEKTQRNHVAFFAFSVAVAFFQRLRKPPIEALFCHPLGHHTRRAECEVYAENEV